MLQRCFNHLDEMVSAQSVSFDAAGDRIYAGLTNEVRIFDVSVPGKGGGWRHSVLFSLETY